MTNYISLIFLAFGLAADAFAVSISEGLREVGINGKRIIKKALIFSAFQGGMPLIGWELGKFFYKFLEVYSKYITFGLLLIIGLKMIYDGMAIKTEDENKTDNIWWLAMATSIDALAIGFSFSMIPDFHIFSSVIMISSITFALSVLGIVLGQKLGKNINFKTEYIGGVILIIIGILTLF